MTLQSTAAAAAAAVPRLSAVSWARASLQVVCPPMRGRPSRNISSLVGSSCNIARGKTKRGLLWVSNKCLEPKIPVMSGSKSRMSVGEIFDRRKLLLASTVGLTIDAFLSELGNSMATTAEFADMPALRGKDYGKTKMQYSDYTKTQSGLQYKDLRVGNGPKPKMGETVVVDWDGYTVGYYGRIFEARNKAKGGSFEGHDKDFFKFKLGSQQVIPAFEEAIVDMAPGGIRRIIVPPELGYPNNDFNKLGPRPTTFSGQRALDFVLGNRGLIDKTLLFDIELLKIIQN